MILKVLIFFSYESGILENPNNSAPKNLYKLTKDQIDASDKFQDIEINFLKGVPNFIKDCERNEIFSGPLKIMEILNKFGGNHGIGRIDIVENRYIGLKSRGIYESPGAKILHEAHKDLEIFLLDKEILRLKFYLSDKMSDYVYNG